MSNGVGSSDIIPTANGHDSAHSSNPALLALTYNNDDNLHHKENNQQQVRMGVTYQNRTVFFTEQKTSVKVGRDESNDIAIRATKALTLELVIFENKVSVVVRQSEIPVFLTRRGIADGVLLKHGHIYENDSDVKQNYAPNEGVGKNTFFVEVPEV